MNYTIYPQYITDLEKRKLLGCFRNKLLLKNKEVYLENY